MRERLGPTLVLLFSFTAQTQTVPAGWKVIKEGKGACQIAVPPEWVPFGEMSGAATFHDATTAIAVVTSRPGQEFKPLGRNSLDEMCMATPAVVRGNLLIRTMTKLYRIGAAE